MLVAGRPTQQSEAVVGNLFRFSISNANGQLFILPVLVVITPLIQMLFRFISAPFTCEYEGKRYRSLEKFISGVNGCAQCICIDGNVNCDESKCQILVDPPETPSFNVPLPPRQPSPPLPVATTTTTTTTTVKPAIIGTRYISCVSF